MPIKISREQQEELDPLIARAADLGCLHFEDLVVEAYKLGREHGSITPETQLAAARAYCETSFNYDSAYRSEEARSLRIRDDAQAVLERPWFCAIINALGENIS